MTSSVITGTDETCGGLFHAALVQKPPYQQTSENTDSVYNELRVQTRLGIRDTGGFTEGVILQYVYIVLA